jgi:Dolichyl-phosphate-mannose-protein mannosyltransferase
MTGAAEARPQARTRRRADSLPSRAMMVAVWIASVSYVGSRITRDWTPHDEGLLAQSAERLLAGQIPHRDFGDAYTGLLTAYHATAFAIGGHSLLTLRFALLVAFALWVPAFYAIAVRFIPPLAAALATAVAVVWSVPNYSASMPTWYNLFFATAGTWAVIRFIESKARRWLTVAGVCAGLSVLVKIVGIYFIIAVVVFLYWRSLDAGGKWQGESPSVRSRRWLRAGVAAVAAIALSLGLLVLMWHDIGPGTVLQFVLPVAATSVVVAVAGTRSEGIEWRPLWRDLWAFALGIVVPVALFLIPYVASHAVGALLTGVFISPLRRLVSATLAPPGFGAAARALPIAAGLWITSVSHGRTQRILAWSTIPLALLVLLLSGREVVYSSLIDAARTTVPIAACAAAVLLLHTQHATRRSLDRQRAVMVVFAAVFFSLVQFPYAATIYFCYVAPLAVLASIAVLYGLSRRVPAAVGGVLLAFLLCFGVGRLNTRAFRSLASGLNPKPNSLLAIPRGGIRVSPEDSTIYTNLVHTLRAHATSDYTLCTPDCPEAYFLAGLNNPTRTTYEFLNDPPISAQSVLQRVDAHQVGVVAVNRQFRFSEIDPALLRALDQQYPDSERVGYFTVRWR